MASLALAGTLAAPSPAGAQESEEAGPRLVRACERIPLIEARLDYVMGVIDGDETRRGSLLWLQERSNQASGNGRGPMATVYQNRHQVRTQAREVLQLRQEIVDSYRDTCVEYGIDP
jgi:hypothetical protein